MRKEKAKGRFGGGRWMAMAGALAAAGLLGACGARTDPDFIGSAIVEAETYQVAALTQGQLKSLYKQEGQSVAAGELLGIVDTVPYALQLLEARAGLAESDAGKRSQQSQIQGGQAEVKGLERDYARIAPLAKEGSLPAQQEDKLASGLDAGRAKLSAARQMLTSMDAKRQGLEARIGLLQDQLRKCYLRAPVAGRVLTRYKNPDETTAPGQPVYEIGREDTLRIDFFVPQTWLSGIKYGQAVRIRLDQGGSKEGSFLPAAVSWIGNEAEFSPKNIQTRESRNELVFRVRALAANKDGLLKRGLPVEVWK
ncbi:MAG: HlyD family efflux transporter periplasmic adaptor subunit [Fibrobacteres bacterium]|jgi:HlyD family secretion protein|nr:HlyD family efflux transporter periplasmic adaptor subunit [Fibrobacterota bacterium]